MPMALTWDVGRCGEPRTCYAAIYYAVNHLSSHSLGSILIQDWIDKGRFKHGRKPCEQGFTDVGNGAHDAPLCANDSQRLLVLCYW